MSDGEPLFGIFLLGVRFHGKGVGGYWIGSTLVSECNRSNIANEL